ncbi:MAG: helix-turn-helix domain-containing protein [bacterium]|nr:helix-turn-helix domain-containing protein [bacterium]
MISVMRKDKFLAIKLRLQGKSYGEIQKILPGISKSTLSLWLKDKVLSINARERIENRSRQRSLEGLLKRNQNQTRLAIQRKEEIQKLARDEIKNISLQNLFFIGLALYWAEGYKRPIVRNGKEVTYHPISLTNADPVLINVFLAFIRRICNVPVKKIKANLRIFQHLNGEEVLKYWVDTTGIPRENFNKTYLGVSKSSMGKRPFNRLPYGVLQVRISDTKLFHRLIGWIAGIKNHDFS